MNASYRVLVLSDLHAIVGGASGQSLMHYGIAAADPRRVLELCHSAVMKEFDGGVDLVVVCGDITDRAASGALESAWADLQWLAGELGVPLVATSGNHDYDSRGSTGPMPNASLMRLEPPFPFGTEHDRDKYFAQHHAVFADDIALVVTADSAAHHGYVYEGEAEQDHGRYSAELPEFIGRSLEKLDFLPAVKIFITHHHLNQLPEFDDEERSFSIGHEAVLRKLSEYGNWLIIHGHKHRGWVQYASGTGDAPPLISASSFSADFGGGSFAEKVRHQFHVVSVPTDSAEVLEGITGARGTITSWTHSSLGWKLASADDQLPGVTGFGWKTNLESLASRLRHEVEREGFLGWQDLLTLESRIEFLTFDDLRRLSGWLSRGAPRIRVINDDLGLPRELSIVGAA